MGGKLALVGAAAIFIPPAEVGHYGQVSGVVTLGVLLIGLDYYTHANRELVSVAHGDRAAVLRAQFRLYSGLYVLLPGVAGIAVIFGADWTLAFWALVIAIAEHLAQEVNRILIAMDQQSAGAIVSFLRVGLWGYAATIAMFIWPLTRNLETIFALWLICTLGAIAVGASALNRRGYLMLTGKTKLRDVRHGLRKSWPFFVGTVALSATLTADRFLAGWGTSADALAAYVLYVTLAGSMRSILDAVVLTFSLPRMLHAAAVNDSVALRAHFLKAVRESFFITIAVGLGGILLVGTLGLAVLPPEYAMYFWMLPILLFAFGSFGVSLPAHQAMYALRMDRVVQVANASTLVIFLPLVLLFHWLGSGALGVPVSLAISMLIAGAIRLIYATRSLKLR